MEVTFHAHCVFLPSAVSAATICSCFRLDREVLIDLSMPATAESPGIATRLEDHAELRSLCLELRRRSSGRHSEILEYESRARPGGVIVKRSTDTIEAHEVEAKILREYEALQIIRKSLPKQLLDTVPQPLMIVRQSRALVLEAISGTPLNRILKREANTIVGPLRSVRMRALGGLTGHWLKQLHQATRREPLLHSSSGFLEAVDERLERCRSIGVRADEIRNTKRLLTDASHKIEGHPIPVAARQGDFIPQNILVDGYRVRVVDFENFSQSDCIYQDAATFISYVQALSAFPYYSQRALLKLSRAFLEAYGLSGDEFPLRLYLARAVIWLISELNLDGAFLRKRLQLLRDQLHRACGELAYD